MYQPFFYHHFRVYHCHEVKYNHCLHNKGCLLLVTSNCFLRFGWHYEQWHLLWRCRTRAHRNTRHLLINQQIQKLKKCKLHGICIIRFYGHFLITRIILTLFCLYLFANPEYSLWSVSFLS